MSKKWSSSLIKATARSLQDIGSVNPTDGCLHLKCIDGKYGTITATNLTKGRFEIEIKSSEDKLLFESADKMIEAGWAID